MAPRVAALLAGLVTAMMTVIAVMSVMMTTPSVLASAPLKFNVTEHLGGNAAAVCTTFYKPGSKSSPFGKADSARADVLLDALLAAIANVTGEDVFREPSVRSVHESRMLAYYCKFKKLAESRRSLRHTYMRTRTRISDVIKENARLSREIVDLELGNLHLRAQISTTLDDDSEALINSFLETDVSADLANTAPLQAPTTT